MIAQGKRILAGCPDRQLLPVVINDVVVRFQRIVLDFLKAKGVFEDMIRLGKALGYVFASEGQVVTDIRAVESFWRAVDRTAQLRSSNAGSVHQSGARRRGFFYVRYFRELFVFDFDQ